MLINIHYCDAANLLWELLDAIPEERRDQFASRVDKIASDLCHPVLDGAVSCAFGGDSTFQSAITL